VTHQNILFVAVPVVEAVSATVFEFAATSALPSAHPVAVSEGLKTQLPNLIKIIAIDISLSERAVDVGAGGNGAVDQDGSDVDACPAEERGVAHERFIGTDIAFTAEADL